MSETARKVRNSTKLHVMQSGGSRVTYIPKLSLVLALALASFNMAQAQDSAFSVRRDPDRPRSDFWMPLSNLLLPGLDQWWEGQYRYGAVYSGLWLGGRYYAALVADRNDLEGQIERRRRLSREAGKEEDNYAIDARDNTVRKYMLGQLLAQGASGFSAWHSFRTAVKTRQQHNQYGFLAKEESPGDLMLAPLQFEHLLKPTTFVPLAISAGLAALVLNSDPGSDYERTAFRPVDGFFASAFSWNAGTHEEAFFRGYLMPVMNEYWGSPLLANLLQSSLFAVAHINSNPRPLPQFFLGLHLGSVSQRRDWTLSEAVFIHTWWDIIAFSVAYHYKQNDMNASGGLASTLRPVLWLPPFSVYF